MDSSNIKKAYCTSTIFKRDLSELCDDCPLRNELLELIEDNLKNAAEKKFLLGKQRFSEFVNEEIEVTGKRMSQTLSTEYSNKNYKKDPYRRNRIKNYILFKEWIKGLNRLLEVGVTNKRLGSNLKLEDLFVDKLNYEKIIQLLYENEFLKNDNKNILIWKGSPNESSLSELKLLGVLGIVLKKKNYLKPKTSKKQISIALSNTFRDYDLSEQNYGKIEKEILERLENSKASVYYNSFHFIRVL